MAGNQNARKHHIARETLVQLYEVEHLSIAEIERRTNCGTIHRELVRFGIPRRRTRSVRVAPVVEPTVLDMAYAAGFFDGEGSINIRNPGSSAKSTGCALAIHVAQASEASLIWLQQRWGGGVRLTKRERPIWEWCLGSRSACLFLQDLLPFLIVKREQAVIAIDFQSHKRNTGRRRDPEAITSPETHS
jgi:hypothetical protein